MKFKFIFLSIFIFAFAVATPLTQVFADTEVIVNPGEDIYDPIISIDDTFGDIVIPGILGAILYYGGEVAFGEPITFDSLVDSFNSAARSFDWYDIEKEILRRSPANDLIQWTPENPQESVESWESLLKTCADFWLDNIELSNNENQVVPDPDPNYNIYLQKLNGTSGGYSFFWKYYSNTGMNYYNNIFTLNGSWEQYSYYSSNYNNVLRNNFNSQYVLSEAVYPCNILTFNIYSTGNNDEYSVLTSGSSISHVFTSPTLSSADWRGFYLDNGSSNDTFKSSFQPTTAQTNFNYSKTGTLTEIFEDMIKYFKNVNVYVNGVPWSIVGNNISQYYITENTYITDSSVPIKYEVPNGTYFDYVKMKNYIISAINNSGVLKYEDIEDCFVDINGVTAVYTVQVQRNDFDNMFDELYSPIYYPKFSVDTQIQPDIQNGVTIINNAVGIIPDDILRVLIYGCSITLFAFLVKKLIE